MTTTIKLNLNNKLLIATIVSLLIFANCTSPYQTEVNSYNEIKSKVSLGMSFSQASSILPYAQKTDSYIKDGKRVDILYIRSDWISDGKTTDDELTPYIFEDQILVGIGWTMLGGAKTSGTPNTGGGVTNCYEFWNAYINMYQTVCY